MAEKALTAVIQEAYIQGGACQRLRAAKPGGVARRRGLALRQLPWSALRTRDPS